MEAGSDIILRVTLDNLFFWGERKPTAILFLQFVDLGKTAAIYVNVSVLLGLELTIKASFNNVVEVIMNNSFVLRACVWFGVAFLRA